MTSIHNNVPKAPPASQHRYEASTPKAIAALGIGTAAAVVTPVLAHRGSVIADATFNGAQPWHSATRFHGIGMLGAGAVAGTAAVLLSKPDSVSAPSTAFGAGALAGAAAVGITHVSQHIAGTAKLSVGGVALSVASVIGGAIAGGTTGKVAAGFVEQ